MTAADTERIEAFYRQMDTYLRLVGAAEMGRKNIFVRLSRYTANASIDYSQATRILDRISDLDSWYPAWSEVAAEFESMALTALEMRRRSTAADYLVRAAQLYHWSQINVPPHDPRKVRGRNQSIAAYRLAAPLLSPPARQLEIPFESREMPGYLRVPEAPGPHNLVVFIDGANSVKEEYHLWTEVMLERGLATLVFDGPGQGEFSPAMGGIPIRMRGYESAVSAVLDHVEPLMGEALGSVAVWGNSFGGYLVARAAAHDSRIRAAVSLGGFYDFREFPRLGIPIREELRDLMGLPTISEAIAMVDAECSLDDCVGKVGVPFLVIHGAKDDLLTTAEAEDLAGVAGDKGELLVIEDGLHCCYNRYLELRPSVADWLAGQLAGDEHAPHLSFR